MDPIQLDQTHHASLGAKRVDEAFQQIAYDDDLANRLYETSNELVGLKSK